MSASKPARVVSVLLLLTLGVACGATRQARKAEPHGFLGDYSMLAKNSDEFGKLTYEAADADWASYDKIQLDPIQFWRGSDVEAGLTPEEGQTLANYAYSTIHANLARDYQMVDEPGAGTLRISIALTRLGNRNVTLDTVSTLVPQMRLLAEAQAVFTGKPSFVGDASLEAKATDAETGQLLGAAVDRRVGGKSLKRFDSWVDVRKSIDEWARLLALRLCLLRGDGADRCTQADRGA